MPTICPYYAPKILQTFSNWYGKIGHYCDSCKLDCRHSYLKLEPDTGYAMAAIQTVIQYLAEEKANE